MHARPDIPDRGRLRVEESGQGPGLICLHGLGGGAYFFRDMAGALSSRYRVLRLDLPGTGANAGFTRTFSFETCVESLLDLMKNGFASPVTVLGHSMGTIIALLAYERSPELFSSLIFANGLPKILPSIERRLTERLESIRRAGMRGLGMQAAAGVFSPGSLRDLPEVVADFARRFEATDPGRYTQAVEELLAADATRIPPTVKIPCLLMTGRDDTYAPPGEVAKLQALIPAPTSMVVLEGCGHLPFLEAPAEFAAAVHGFMGAQSLQAGDG